MKDFQSTSQPLFSNNGARLMNKDFWGFVPQSYIENETVSESNCLIFIGGYLAGVAAPASLLTRRVRGCNGIYHLKQPLQLQLFLNDLQKHNYEFYYKVIQNNTR